jgi:hypothetical protein
MSKQQTLKQGNNTITERQGYAVTEQGTPTTSGYVPVVGVPDSPTVPVSSTNSAETKFTVSSLEPPPPAHTAARSEKTKACQVNFTDETQYLQNAGGGWDKVTSAPFPFILNFALNTPTSIANNEQLAASITNNTTGAAKLELTYWTGTTIDHDGGVITFLRS